MKKIITVGMLCVVFLACGKSESFEIRVASYNLRMDTPSDGINAWPHRKEFVTALIQYHDFDIIGTQEGYLHQLKDLCEMPGYTYLGVGRDDGKEAGEHSAVLYKKDRFSVVSSGNFWLSETPDKPGLGWDATCCNRICSWAKLKEKKSGSIFYFFNVHFDHQGIVARRESGILMEKKIKEIAENTPVICTGDFNSTPETEQIKTMSEFLCDSYRTAELPPYGPVGTFNGFNFTALLHDRIDYVFVSKHFRVMKYAALTDAVNQQYPSDHQPVVVDLLFK
jgi:endonuclease/exonuclease/phosphatase family metal-dependent hydrolase